MYFILSKILAPLINPTNLLILLILLCKFINIKIKKKFIKIILNFLLFLFLTIVIFPVGKIGMNFLEKDTFSEVDFENFQNIIVLSGSEEYNLTKFSNKLNLNGSSERLIAAVKLALINTNAKILFVGGNSEIINNQVDDTLVAKLFFKDVGFDLKRVVFIQNTKNTIENIKSLKSLGIDDKKNILITSAFHMKRVLIISNYFNFEFIPYSVDHKTSKNNSPFINNYQFFSTVNNLSLFDTFFREIIGILAFKLFYKF